MSRLREALVFFGLADPPGPKRVRSWRERWLSSAAAAAVIAVASGIVSVIGLRSDLARAIVWLALVVVLVAGRLLLAGGIARTRRRQRRP